MAEERKKVLFVCTGNTCRSPMAEGLFRKMVGEKYEMASAGVAAMNGGLMSNETGNVLRQKGAMIEGFRSQMVTKELVEEVEGIFCMTEGHREMIEMLHPESAKKCQLICDFHPEMKGADVPDPIGSGMAAYEEVGKVLEEALLGLKNYLDS